MSYFFNKITDMIKNKVYVDRGPLEDSTEIKSNSNNDINGNEVKKISDSKETEKVNKNEEQQEILNEENSSNHILQTFNNSLSVNLYTNPTFESFRTEFNVS